MSLQKELPDHLKGPQAQTELLAISKTSLKKVLEDSLILGYQYIDISSLE